MITTLGDLQIGIVLWRELNANRRQQIRKGVMGLWQMQMDSLHYLLSGMRTCYRKDFRVNTLNQITAVSIFSGTKTACNNHLAIFRQSFTNCRKTFLYSRVNKTTGIHNHKIRARIILGGLVTLGTQLCEDKLRIYQRLGTSQGNKTNFTRHNYSFSAGLG